MKFVITLIMLMFVLGSCGKKSEPIYKKEQAFINKIGGKSPIDKILTIIAVYLQIL